VSVTFIHLDTLKLEQLNIKHTLGMFLKACPCDACTQPLNHASSSLAQVPKEKKKRKLQMGQELL